MQTVDTLNIGLKLKELGDVKFYELNSKIK
jgi:hypothetical protein